MWIKQINLQNIKCFSELDLSFVGGSKEAEPYRWITLLGENGSGKSTILRALGFMLAGPDPAQQLPVKPANWLREGASEKYGKATVTIYQDEEKSEGAQIDQGDFTSQKRRQFTYSCYFTGYEEVQLPSKKSGPKKEGELYLIRRGPSITFEITQPLSWLRAYALYSGAKGWFAAGYGAFRHSGQSSGGQMSEQKVASNDREAYFETLFSDERSITTFEKWMTYLKWAIDTKSDEHAESKLIKTIQIVTALFPQPDDYNAKIRYDHIDQEGRVIFNVDGVCIPSTELSDGYRSLLALTGDLMWRLVQSFPHLSDLKQASGVVLIDELDTHLHPRWQREIPQSLQRAFPRLQFIVATHSPLIAIGAGENALTLRCQIEQGKVKVQPIQDAYLYEVDDILRSPAFDLQYTNSPDAQELQEHYQELRDQQLTGLSPEQETILQQMEEKISKMNRGFPIRGSLDEKISRFLDQWPVKASG